MLFSNGPDVLVIGNIVASYERIKIIGNLCRLQTFYAVLGRSCNKSNFSFLLVEDF